MENITVEETSPTPEFCPEPRAYINENSNSASALNPANTPVILSEKEAQKLIFGISSPIRQDIVNFIYLRQYARATDVARHLKKPVNAISYHLRTLYTLGAIEPANEKARDRRDRVWKISNKSMSLENQPHLYPHAGYRQAITLTAQLRIRDFSDNLLKVIEQSYSEERRNDENSNLETETPILEKKSKDSQNQYFSGLNSKSFTLTQSQAQELFKELCEIHDKYVAISRKNLLTEAIYDNFHFLAGIAQIPEN